METDQPSAETPSERPGSRGAEADAPLHVIGMGASAGGISALRHFFEAVPPDTGLVFVVVMHLAPDRASSLAEVLQPHAALPIRQVTGRVRMEADHVYVIPPGKNLELTDGHLILTDFDQPRGRRAPIDVFFRTLARTHPDGIGVLLSGSGTDGTVGMKAIKEQGGLLMVQDPEEAAYDAMPRSALATGLVDFVLPVRALAERLVDLQRSGLPLHLPSRPEALPEDEAATLRKILTRLRAQTGHDFGGYKRSTVLRRIGRRMRVCQTEDLSAYLGFLQEHEAEAQALQKDLLLSVTNFFRDPAAFEALEREVIPRLFEGKGTDDEIRVWVPGCATGEEAYSIAMLLLEHAAERTPRPPIQVFASDLDGDALAYAREGLYPEAIVTDVTEARLRRFFTREGVYVRAKKELRDTILFATHSLLKDPPFSRLDLVSCRNLLIYLRRDLQERVFELFHYALQAGGYLFLGTSESAEGATALFRTLDKKHRLYRRREASGELVERLPDLPLSVATRGRTPLPRPRGTSAQQTASDGALHQEALEAHAPPSLLVDEDYSVIHTSPSAGRYLQFPGGSPTSHLMAIVRAELRLELRTALHQALKQGQAVHARPLPVQIEGERRLVQLFVSPVRLGEEPPRALVMFLEAPPEAPAGRAGEAAPGTDGRLREMEDALDDARAHLQASVEESEARQEELRAANEELQSTNEEYKSTLEELETSKEELQSVNEELRTVNEELQGKVEALSRANNDLKNLIDATDVATLFLDRHLRIKRYTPPLGLLFNVMPVDAGRPLGHVTRRIDYAEVESDARAVLQTLIPMEREVLHEEGRTFLARVTLYRTTEDRIEGVVMTFTDITRIRMAQEELRRSEERHRLLIEGVREYAIFMTDSGGHVTAWNPGAERIFGYGERDVLGRHVALLFTGEDRAADVPAAEMQAALEEGQATNERWHVRQDESRFWGSGILTALYDENGAPQGFVKVLRDNTRRREANEALRRSQERLRALNETLEERVEARTAELKQANEHVRRLASELVVAEQRERHRLAQLLHDDLQQRLYGIQMKMPFIRQDLASGQAEAVQAHAEEAEAWLHEAIQMTRRLTVDLSPPVLKGEGLPEALGWLARQMRELHGLRVEVRQEDGAPLPAQDEGMRVLLFQVVRELLFNVVKHADVEQAVVTLRAEDGRLVAEVRDHGAGFDTEVAAGHPEGGTGLGLTSMRERLRLAGGHLEIVSAPGEGTRAVVYAP